MMSGVRSGRVYIELHKVKTEIDKHGSMYFVFRKQLDSYGEDTGETKMVEVVKGLFHITKGYISRLEDDGTNTRIKGQPKMLVLHDEIKNTKAGDIIHVNNKKYKINEINNIGELNIVCDLSLEVILDGNI